MFKTARSIDRLWAYCFSRQFYHFAFWGIFIAWYYLLIRISKSIDKTLAATNAKDKD